jgi:hypothetical protein
VAKDDDDDAIIVPKKSSSTSKKKGSSGGTQGASAQMRRLMRITCGIGIAFGGFISLIGVMAVVGLAVDNIWVRLIVGLLFVIGLPAFLADRLLKRSDSNLATKGGLGMVANVFAIVLLGAALMLVAADAITKSLIRHEGDLYARSGSTTMARLVYFVAGVAPVFPFEKTGPNAAGSASASGSASAHPSPSGGAAPPPSK